MMKMGCEMDETVIDSVVIDIYKDVSGQGLYCWILKIYGYEVGNSAFLYPSELEALKHAQKALYRWVKEQESKPDIVAEVEVMADIPFPEDLHERNWDHISACLRMELYAQSCDYEVHDATVEFCFKSYDTPSRMLSYTLIAMNHQFFSDTQIINHCLDNIRLLHGIVGL
jgi:hypothetical protein